MASQPHERLIRAHEVDSQTGLSPSERYRRITAGTFPAPIKLGTRAVAWRESEVQDWIRRTVEAGRIEGASA